MDIFYTYYSIVLTCTLYRKYVRLKAMQKTGGKSRLWRVKMCVSSMYIGTYRSTYNVPLPLTLRPNTMAYMCYTFEGTFLSSLFRQRVLLSRLHFLNSHTVASTRASGL